MKFIRLSQPDPHYKVLPAQLIVAVEHIVKIEPIYYETDKDGNGFVKQVSKYTEEDFLRGIQKIYVVWDSLGNQYYSHKLDERPRQFLEKLWMDSIQ